MGVFEEDEDEEFVVDFVNQESDVLNFYLKWLIAEDEVEVALALRDGELTGSVKGGRERMETRCGGVHGMARVEMPVFPLKSQQS